MIEPMGTRIHLLEKEVPRFMADLEERFGLRDPQFKFGRILLGRWPHISCPRKSRIIDICLTKEALEDPDETWAKWQLAHECLHLIDPHEDPTNVLEEGLAVWYQNKKVTRQFADHEGPYAEAEKLATPFINTLHVAIRRIRQERRLAIGDIPANVLIRFCPEVEGVAQELTRRFHR